MRRRNIPHRKISIHALCEEGDSFSFSNRPVFSSFLSTPSARRATKDLALELVEKAISIHALCEEGDKLRSATLSCRSVFLSTPSARRATILATRAFLDALDFYPRPLRGGRLTETPSSMAGGLFLSTPSARRATNRNAVKHGGWSISIHALCEEGDSRRCTKAA